MIHHIQGAVVHQNDQSIVVDVGSIGMQLMVAQPTSFAIEQKVTLFVHMHWNQEQGPTLYGFPQLLDKTVFLLIISCSGIGPKIALSLLANLGSQQFLQAIAQEKEPLLSKAPGIGTKKAEQLIVHLRSKVTKLLASGVALDDGHDVHHITEVAQALASLRYTPSEVASAMRHLSSTYQGVALPFDQLMRHALSFLAKKA